MLSRINSRVSAFLITMLLLIHHGGLHQASSTLPVTSIVFSSLRPTTETTTSSNTPTNKPSIPTIKDITTPLPTINTSLFTSQSITAIKKPVASTTTKQHTKIQETDTCTCGVSSVEDNTSISVRVIGGSIASPHFYPWQAILHYYQWQVCSGTVINNKYILTAVHCINMMKNIQRKLEEKYGNKLGKSSNGNVNLKKISVVLGAHDRVNLSSCTKMNVESYLIHPNHTAGVVYDINDIALIKLAQRVQYNSNVLPICLPYPGQQFGGMRGVVVGWGQTHFNGSDSRFLKHAMVYILSDTICAKSRLGHLFRIDPSSMICAYEYKTDACKGDSGGPLLYKSSTGVFIQVGIVSWGIECAKIGYPGIYAEVSSFIDWIHDNTQDAEYCTVP